MFTFTIYLSDMLTVVLLKLLGVGFCFYASYQGVEYFERWCINKKWTMIIDQYDLVVEAEINDENREQDHEAEITMWPGKYSEFDSRDVRLYSNERRILKWIATNTQIDIGVAVVHTLNNTMEATFLYIDPNKDTPLTPRCAGALCVSSSLIQQLATELSRIIHVNTWEDYFRKDCKLSFVSTQERTCLDVLQDRFDRAFPLLLSHSRNPSETGTIKTPNMVYEYQEVFLVLNSVMTTHWTPGSGKFDTEAMHSLFPLGTFPLYDVVFGNFDGVPFSLNMKMASYLTWIRESREKLMVPGKTLREVLPGAMAGFVDAANAWDVLEEHYIEGGGV